MKIVIAPSKTMKYQKVPFVGSEPLFPEETQYLTNILKQYNDEQLCQLMKISYKQATQVYQYFHEEQTAHPALAFYQGTVFKQLELASYMNHQDYLSEHLCILDAYYGVLKYNTLITPYRLDMTMKPDHINLYDYWYTPLYQYFEQVDFIISLASKEFTNMLRHPHIYFIDFIINDHGKIKRNAMIIKKARGQMLNQMILNEIKTLDELKTLNIDGFTYQPDYNQEGTLAFVKNM
ncbi:MAG: YaaA family protein [Massilimicrobiota timonensis]